MPSTELSTLLRETAVQLQTTLGLDAAAARIEAQMLMQHALGVTRAWLLAHPEHRLDDAQQTRHAGALARRLAGEPLAYILGSREFYGLNFRVTPATLIPRPETELLVELALQRLPQHARILDLGTGTGAIALAIAHARSDAEITAVDASAEALDVARENAERLGIANARFSQSDWFSALADERYDLIVSNPPYIAENDAHLAQGDLRFEPRTALASGTDGLDDIRRIIAASRKHLAPAGWLLFEHGYDQAGRVRGLLEAAGYAEVFSARDLAGIERVSGGRVA